MDVHATLSLNFRLFNCQRDFLTVTMELTDQRLSICRFNGDIRSLRFAASTVRYKKNQGEFSDARKSTEGLMAKLNATLGPTCRLRKATWSISPCSLVTPVQLGSVWPLKLEVECAFLRLNSNSATSPHTASANPHTGEFRSQRSTASAQLQRFSMSAVREIRTLLTP